MDDRIGLDESRRFLVVGERRWPVVEAECENTVIPADVRPSGVDYDIVFFQRRAWVVFENGWGVSVLWGTATGSDNNRHGNGPHSNPDFIEEPELVEVGILHRGELIDDPRYWVGADELTEMLHLLSRLPSDRAETEALIREWVAR